jgi:BlaR1 peptidase M56
VGLLQLRTLRANCTTIDAATLDPLLQETLQGIQPVRPVALCQSGRIQVPTAIGFFKPLVVIPSWALQELSTAELNSILIHELAHLRRRDDWTNLAQQLLKALLFFHPAVWWIESQLALEREMACDDAVLAETGNPRGYAQCLVSIAEKSFLRLGLALAQAAVNRMRQTSLRVSQILDVNRSSATRVWKPALYSVAAFFAICLVSFSHAPELVAFKDPMQDRTPEVAIASAIPTNRPLTSAAAPQSAEYRIRKGTSSLVQQSAANKSGLQPLRRRSLEQATFSAAAKSALARRAGRQNLVPSDLGNLAQASSMTARDYAFPAQAIFVVMQTQYDEARPAFWSITVWRVIILDSSPSETRIPAKQI